MAGLKILVIGGGKVSEHLFKIFRVQDEADEVIVVDRERERRQVFENLGDVLFLEGDATDIKLYDEVNMREVTAVLALTNSDETNLLVLAIAKTFNVPIRIGRFTEPEIAELVVKLGLGIPVVQPVVIANVIAQMLTSITNGRELGSVNDEKIIMVTISESDPVVENRIEEINLGDEGRIILLFDGMKFKIPEPGDIVKPGNLLIIAARNSDVVRRIKG
ncbi:MAG: NAD-binding protein [Desulfurococcus sp.]|nr:NAD-binding protein [Desulfurococcus sp.]